MFNWQEFLDQFNIHYVTKGPSVTRGNVAIRCPFCVDDPSEHLSVSIEGKGWRCWRNPNEHAGKSPARLIVALIGCSYARAAEIAGEDRANIPDDLLGRVNELMRTEEQTSDRALSMPAEFKAIRNSTAFWPCINYLRDRGIDDVEIFKLTKRFDLRFATRGPFIDRIIFPVYYEKKLVSFTGRSVRKDAKIRYKTLTTDFDKAKEMGLKPAVGPINNFLLFYDDIIKNKTAHTIVVVEGPFDALILNILGRSLGIIATCIFTNTPTKAQVDLFHDIMPRFERRCILLDNDMYSRALRLRSDLRSLKVEQISLPPGVKDPALLRKVQLKKLFE